MWAMLMREINGSLGIPLLLPTLLQVLELTLRECHKNLKQLPHLLSTCIFVNLHINELNIDSIWINVILFKTWTLISILNNVDLLELRKMKMFKLPKKKLQNCPSFFLFPQNLFYFSSSFFFFSSEQNIFLPHFSPLLSISKNGSHLGWRDGTLIWNHNYVMEQSHGTFTWRNISVTYSYVTINYVKNSFMIFHLHKKHFNDGSFV